MFSKRIFILAFVGGFQLLDLSLKVTLPVKNSRSLIGGNFICQKNPLQDLLSSLNAVISTNERHWIINMRHFVYHPDFC